MKTRELLYSFKKEFGVKNTQIQNKSISSTDYETGISSITQEYINIKQAILFPKDITKINLKLDFAYWQQDTRLLAVEKRDLNNFKIDTESAVIINDQKYNVTMFSNFENFILLLLKEIKGEPVGRITTISIVATNNFNTEVQV